MDLKIGIVQLKPARNIDANLQFGFEAIERLAGRGADVVVLPEMWPCPYDRAWFAQIDGSCGGDLWSRMSRAAADAGVWLIGGSVPEQSEGGLCNTSFVFGADGRQVARHRKLHLFDVDIAGAVRSCESADITPGDSVTTFETPWGVFGICICFDCRFADLYSAMARRDARVIFCPAQFSRATGPDHWVLTQRMRAVDTQAFTVGCDAACDADGPYPAYGHSVVCDPWGRVVCECGEDAETKLVCIDLDEVDRVRAQLPIIAARRDDVYELKEKR